MCQKKSSLLTLHKPRMQKLYTDVESAGKFVFLFIRNIFC